MGVTAQGWALVYPHAVVADAGKLSSNPFKIVRKMFNEKQHPRGADGRWIDKAGYVKFRDQNNQWKLAKVLDFDGKGGVSIIHDGKTEILSAKKLYGATGPVAQIDTSKMKKVGDQGGSNEGGVYQEYPEGAKYYIKKPPTAAHVNNEIIAHRLYAAVGAPTPVVTRNPDGTRFVSKLEDSRAWGDLPNDDERPVAIDEIRKNFVVDAWMANWDAPVTDNIRVTRDGVPLRVDTGGALDYRAQGGSKVDQLTPEVKELKSMRDPNISPSGAQLYAGVTPEHEEDGVRRILALSPDSIREIVKSEGGPGRLADDLIARRAWLATHYNYVLPETTVEGKQILDPPDSSPEVAEGTLPSSLATAVRKLTPGEAQPLAPGSPVWLKKKGDYGKSIPDVWIIESVSPNGDSAVLKPTKGSSGPITAWSSDFKLLRSNYASEAATFSDGKLKPEMNDRVELENGEKGDIIEIFPMYSKVKILGTNKTKVVATKKLTLKLANTTKEEGAAKGGLYNMPYDDSNALMQLAYRGAAVAAIGNEMHTDKKLNVADIEPTQPKDKSLAVDSGMGPVGMKPIVARIDGIDYLLDGHHRATDSKDGMIDAHYVDFDEMKKGK